LIFEDFESRTPQINPSPYRRFANGLSSAVVIAAVVGCAYTAGKRISIAEAFAGPLASDTEGSGQPAPARSDSEAGSERASTVKSDSDQGMPGLAIPAGKSVMASDAGLLDFDATAYSIPGTTAAGVAVRRGTIAADPRILPLGSVVHIRAGEYSGTYLVLDTGPRIKGRKIDIYMPNRREAISFGRRPVRLKVLVRVHPRHLQMK